MNLNNINVSPNIQKRIRIISMIFSVLLAIMVVFPSLCFAGEPTEEPEETPKITSYGAGISELEGNGDAKSSLAKTVYMFRYWGAGGFLMSMSDSDLFLIQTSKTEKAEDGTERTVDVWYWTVFVGIYDVFASFGIGLTTFWCLTEFVNTFTATHASPEQFVTMFCKMVAGMYLIMKGSVVCEWLIQLGNSAVKLVQEKFTKGNLTAFDYEKNVNEVLQLNFFDCLGEIIATIIPAISIMICTIVMLALMYGRLIEIGVRTALAPIGMADAFSHGVHSAGMRYIKKYLAVCFQGVVMFMILIVGTVMGSYVGQSGSIFSGTGISAISQVIVAFSMLGLMLKSQTLVNDIAGV